MDVMFSEENEENINREDAWFFMIGSDSPVERREIEILSGPFTVEELHNLYTKKG